MLGIYADIRNSCSRLSKVRGFNEIDFVAVIRVGNLIGAPSLVVDCIVAVIRVHIHVVVLVTPVRSYGGGGGDGCTIKKMEGGMGARRNDRVPLLILM